MTKLFTLLLVVLFGCASVPVESMNDPGEVPSRWEARPVTVVASADMSPACLVALDDALAFWREQGVGYLLLEVAAHYDWHFDGTDRSGVVTVQSGGLEDPGASGETHRVRTVTGAMFSADIRIDDPKWCRAQTLAHELGHALGLAHREDDQRALMWPATLPGGWDLSAAELERVR